MAENKTPLFQALDVHIARLYEHGDPLKRDNNLGTAALVGIIHTIACALRETRELHQGLNTAVAMMKDDHDLASAARLLKLERWVSSISDNHAALAEHVHNDGAGTLSITERLASLEARMDAHELPVGKGQFKRISPPEVTASATRASMPELVQALKRINELEAALKVAVDRDNAMRAERSALVAERDDLRAHRRRVDEAYDLGIKTWREATGSVMKLPLTRAELVPWLLATLEDERNATNTEIDKLNRQIEQVNASYAALVAIQNATHDEVLTLQGREARLIEQVERQREAIAGLQGSEASAMRAITSSNRQLEVTQAQLDKFMGACADQTVQIMELRGNERAELQRVVSDQAKQIAELREQLERERGAHAGAIGRREHESEERRSAGYKLNQQLTSLRDRISFAVGLPTGTWIEWDDLVRKIEEQRQASIAAVDEADKTVVSEADALAKLERLQPLLEAINACKEAGPDSGWVWKHADVEAVIDAATKWIAAERAGAGATSE